MPDDYSDDYSSDIFTTGVINIGGPGTAGVNEVTTDDDWFRIDFDRYYTYELEIISDSSHALPANEVFARVMDENGRLVREYTARHLPRKFRFAAKQYGGSYFASILRGDGAYVVTAKLVDDYSGPFKENFITHSEIQYGAIESVGDEDPHIVQLLKGTTYTINVYGSENTDATLVDPRVELFQKNGTLLASDDNSGQGSNARLTFTPSFTDFFTINILSANGGTGSYVLEIPELDDFSNDIATTGVLELGTPSAGSIFWNDESDWFRITLDRYFTYRFTSVRDPNATVQTRPFVQIFDKTGALVSRNNPGAGNLEHFTATYNGDYFVSATNGFGGYLLNGEIIDDYGDVTRTNYSTKRRFTGAIETSGDQDGFQVPLAKGATYEINLVGQAIAGNTLSDPFLEVYTKRGGSVLGSDNDSGAGTNSKIFFTPTENGLFQLGASGNNQATGSYALSLRAADDYDGNVGTSSLLTLVDGFAQTAGILEFADDIDWHAIDFKANRLYQVYSDVNEIGVRDTQLNYQTIPFEGVKAMRMRYQANATGRYYIVTRREVFFNPQPMSYSLSVVEIPPVLTVQPMPQLNGRDSTIMNFVDPNTGYSNGDRFEVYANNWLQSDGQAIAPNQLLENLTLNEFSKLEISESFRGRSQVWVRMKPKGYDQWSNWGAIGVYGTQIPDGLLASGPSQTVYYSFADTKPNYYSTSVPFQPLTQAEKETVRNAIGYWDEALGIDFVERNQGDGDGTTNDEMMIFKSQMGSANTIGYYPGIKRGYDLRISSSTTVMQGSWPESGQAFYEILRGIGSSLGLKPNPEQNRTETLMGLRSDPETWFLPFPSRPLPLDTLLIEKSNEYSFGISANLDNTVYTMSGQAFFETIVDGFGNDTIDASGQNLRTRIDLRPGATSYTGANFNRPHTFVNSPYAFLENAIGGPLNDVIIGSNLGVSNRLEGRNGNDFLMGMQGNDWLFGGRNNDTYFFEMNSGRDNISEQNLGGFDRIVILGQHNFDSLPDDLLFRRLGNDLIIKMDMDRLGDSNADTIAIRNMGIPQSRVERLDLKNQTDGQFATVSLPSIFAQAGDSFSRFSLAPGSDAFGQLVQPV